MKRRSIFYSASEGKVMGQKLAAVGLKDSFLKKNFYNLSLGERQRVVIGVLLSMNLTCYFLMSL